ncbi:hypothetical protein H7F15_06295 [Pontibacter sp. Tf4]|uniref:hypothetical protein n=1 Tax=Pontibacter sp. Tf4 TaxID=2761620 RepID=UPI0016236EB5|nr:hypothetical protein [Pontibacter sp. Tf4]MBB6610639.1 hypothetical protein [Pontibacter sp. Tf4]
MEYRSIHYWQYEPDIQETLILEEAVAFTGRENEADLLQAIGCFIAKHTGALYTMIALLADDLKQASTVAFITEKTVLPNITYTLKGTPCDEVVTQRFCYYPLNVAQAFPEDKEFEEKKIECYMGSILLSHNNEPLGLVALMHDKPLQNVAFAEHLILVLSPTIEAELAKLKVMQVQS